MSVLILGGGPAGAAAALTLRGAGVAATVLESSPFPRYRPGETLHPGVEPLLERLGVAGSLLDAGYLRHVGHWVDWAGREEFMRFGEDGAGPWRGFQAPRADFDGRLLEAAIERGAAVHLGVAPSAPIAEGGRVLGVQTPAGPVHARFTIDATGSSRWLSRRLGIAHDSRSPRLVARFGYATGRGPAPPRLPAIRADAQGFTWVAEIAPGRFHWTRVTRPADRPAHDFVPDVLRDATPESASGADVTWRVARRTAGSGWFLAGDAAGALDPSSSHGVLRALMTGMMAGHLVSRVLVDGAEEDEGARAYHAWLTAWLEHDMGHLTQAYGAAGLFGYGIASAAPRRAADPLRSR